MSDSLWIIDVLDDWTWQAAAFGSLISGSWWVEDAEHAFVTFNGIEHAGAGVVECILTIMREEGMEAP